MLPVVIIRHPKERHSKCSLTPVRWYEGLTFHKALPDFEFNAEGYMLLSPEGPVLTAADQNLFCDETSQEASGLKGLLLLDGTWRLLPKLEACLTGNPVRRSLPIDIQTAYPRVSKETDDPTHGLASIEALYMALKILGHNDPSLLDGYHWKETFLKQFG